MTSNEELRQPPPERPPIHFLIGQLTAALPLLSLSLGGMAAGLLFHIMMAKLLGPSAVGNYGMMLSVLQLLIMVVLFGTNRSIIRLVAAAAIESDGTPSLKPVWGLVLPLTLAASLLLAITAGPLAQTLFHAPDLQRYFLFASAALPATVATSVWAAAHQGRLRVWLAVLLREVVPLGVSCTAMAIWLLFPNPRPSAWPAFCYGAGWGLSALLAGLCWSWLERGHRVACSQRIGQVVRASWPMLLTSGSLLILGLTDTLMLGIYRDSDVVGIYRTALKVSLFTTIGAQSVRKLAAPRLAAVHASGDHREMVRWVRFTAWGNTLATLPLALLTIALPLPLLGVFGEPFRAGAGVLIVLAVSEALRSLFGMPGILLDMTGYAHKFRDATAIAAASNILLNLLLVPKHGAMGAAIATAVSCTAGSVLSWLFVSGKLHLDSSILCREHRMKTTKEGI